MEWGGHLCRVLTGSEQGDWSPSICSYLLLCQVVARRGVHSEEQPWRCLQTSVLTSPEMSGGDGWSCDPAPVTGPVCSGQSCLPVSSEHPQIPQLLTPRL